MLEMSITLLSLVISATFVLTAVLLNKYYSIRGHNPVVSLATFTGWYFSLLIVYILPLDVANTYYLKCQKNDGKTCEKPVSYDENDDLLNLFQVAYWTSQCLTWFILPLLQSYVGDGNFSVLSRMKSAVISNLFYYGLYAVSLFSVLFYAFLQGVSLNTESIKIAIVSAANTWGLFLLVVLLGYGLIEVPRSCWQLANKHYQLRKAYFNIENLSSSKSEAEENLKELFRETRAIQSDTGCQSQDRRVEKILSRFKSDEAVMRILSPSSRMATTLTSSVNKRTTKPSHRQLIQLHEKVLFSIHAFKTTSLQWRQHVDDAMYLEDLMENGQLTNRDSTTRRMWLLRSIFYRICAVLCAAMSLLIIVSECTFQLSATASKWIMSPAAVIVQTYTQSGALIIILYVSLCAYLAIFRLHIYKYYRLSSNGHSDDASIVQSSILVSRLTPPICLNFLSMIGLEKQSDGNETQFTKVMGHLELLPFLAQGINVYLPMCIIVICALNYYRVGARVLDRIGVDQFESGGEMTNEIVRAGKSLVQIERRAMSHAGGLQKRHTLNHGTSTKKCKEIDPESRPMLLDTDDDDEVTTHPPSTGFFDDLL